MPFTDLHNTFYRNIFISGPTYKQQAKSKCHSSFQKLHKVVQEYTSLTVREEASMELLETGETRIRKGR